MSFRSRNALPTLISRYFLSSCACRLTLMDSILREKSRTSHEIDPAAYNITSGEGGSISLASHLTAESIAIISVPTPALWLPTWQFFQGDLWTRKANADHPAKFQYYCRPWCQYPLPIFAFRVDGGLIVVNTGLHGDGVIGSCSSRFMIVQFRSADEVYLQPIRSNLHGLIFVCLSPSRR